MHILEKEEMCTGDPVRRQVLFMFQMMAFQNIRVLNNYGIKKNCNSLPSLF